jgi:putative nucleotidyltransferase with HDIG domain
MILRLIEAEGDGNILVLFLKSLKSYDDYTFRHSINVAVISSAIARHVGLDESSSGRVGLAAIMHDIGKLYVPKSVIHKAGRLSPSEWQLIRKHPVDGARILREEKVDDLISRVAYEHHMRFDGKGYPPARAAEKIHDASHIVRIADSYDALTTKRAYRKQISPYEAIKLMTRTRGSEFHPEYFDVFLHMMGNIPIGSMLELRTGEKVLVVDIRGDGGFLPRVRLLTDADGNEIEDERIIDLNEKDPVTRECRYSIKSIEDSALRNLDIGQYLVHCV